MIFAYITKIKNTQVIMKEKRTDEKYHAVRRVTTYYTFFFEV